MERAVCVGVAVREMDVGVEGRVDAGVEGREDAGVEDDGRERVARCGPRWGRIEVCRSAAPFAIVVARGEEIEADCVVRVHCCQVEVLLVSGTFLFRCGAGTGMDCGCAAGDDRLERGWWLCADQEQRCTTSTWREVALMTIRGLDDVASKLHAATTTPPKRSRPAAYTPSSTTSS